MAELPKAKITFRDWVVAAIVFSALYALAITLIVSGVLVDSSP